MARSLSDDGAAFIAEQEGTVKRNGLHVLYNDPLGHATIGIGHLVHEGPINGSEPEEFKRGLTDEQAWAQFREDAAVYVDAVDRLVTVELTQERFDALVDFAFNWGIGETSGFPATSVLRLVNQRDWAGVAYELVSGRGPSTPQYPNGRPYDKGLAGVRRRRELEAEAFVMDTVSIVRAVIADLEATGIPVQEIDGWEDRGRPYAFNPRGLLWHHTATKGYQYDYPSLGIVRDGRSDLPGPLAQFGIGRITGTVYVIAGGYANHAGGGGWGGLTGNGSVWGIEAEGDGIGEEWTPELIRSYVALSVALCRHGGFESDRICRHAEWSDGGKIDTATSPLDDGDWIRARVAASLNAPVEPDPEPEPDLEVPDLFIFDYKVGEDHRGILYSDGFYCWGVTGQTLAFYNTGKVPHLGAKGPEFLADLTFREKRQSAPTVAQEAASAADLVDVDGCVTLYGPVEALAGARGDGS